MKIIQGVTSYLTVVFIKDQVEFIRKNGYELKVVCNKDFESPYEGLDVHHIPFEREISPIKDFKTLVQLSRYLRKENPGAIHFSTPKAGLLGMTAGFFSRVGVRIYMIRGLRLETATGLKKLVLFITEKLACIFSTHVMVISDSMEREVLRMKLTRPDKIVRIGRGSSNGIDLEKFNPAKIEERSLNVLRKKLRIDDGDFIIGYAGRLTKDKGTDALIEAFEYLYKSSAELKLLLVGNFENGNPVKPEIAKTILTHPNIIHVPYTDGMDYYYSLMHLFILPTYREGFSNVSMEAQSMRVPVVTFDSTGASDTLEHERTGLIAESKDAQGLVKAIQELMNDDKKREGMATVSREFIADHFDRRLMQQQLLNFYDRINEQGDGNAEQDKDFQRT